MYSEHEKIRLLLEETIAHLKESRGEHLRDKQIFKEVLGDTPEMHEAFFIFLHDVSTCPLEVIRWCRVQINTHLSIVK